MRHAGKLFFPLDMRLQLGAEGYSPALLRRIVSQGARYSFAEARQNLDELCGVQISAQHLMRLTERTGAHWEKQRDKECAEFVQNQLPRLYTQPPKAAAVMLDGGRAREREEPSPLPGPGVANPQWREPKYGCFQTLSSRASENDPQPDVPSKFLDKQRVPKLVEQIKSVRGACEARKAGAAPAAPRRRKKSKRPSRCVLRTVIATMCGVNEFGSQVAAEVYKRGLDLAERKACVCDGQASNWTVWELHLKPLGFVAILDFIHLLTYIYGAAQAVGGSATERWDRYAKWLTWAWQGKRDKLLVALNAVVEAAGCAPKDAPESDPRVVLAKARNYAANNIDKMDYPRYRKLGLPISSAPVESVIKQFNRRVKGTEKFWKKSALEALLQVRAAQLSEDGRVERLWATPRPSRAANHRPLKAAA